jgi:hypothetical protein
MNNSLENALGGHIFSRSLSRSPFDARTLFVAKLPQNLAEHSEPHFCIFRRNLQPPNQAANLLLG